ncbi:hypothetical protein [Pseudomonas sp. Marseille-Q1929]|uniref:hypothetical protein n=1 Tax=Pseudomonas sp. Marseille-Q1929 TaxID=2730402 RepID=UPI001A8DB065|nr:hypothetical protein [Pseudomonas sp. Marseille-Q1929]MBO0494663.1 hypothetical protein [Pseudomonas sp. Marseille-Q1929]
MKSAITNPGFLDPSFADNGRLIPSLSRAGGVRALAVDPQQRLLYILQADEQFLLFRSDLNGGADTSFGTEGVVTGDFGPGLNSWASEVLVQGDGKIVVVGEVKDSPEKGRLAITRFDSNGALDTLYGKRIIPLPTDTADVTRKPSAALDDDDSLLMAYNSGVVMDPEGRTRDTGWVVKVSPEGEPDPTFGAGTGFIDVRFSDANTILHAIGVQSDGRVVVVGAQGFHNSAVTESFAAVAGFSPDGQVDSGFGDGGLIISSMGNSGFYCMALDKDHIVAAGHAFELQAMVTKYTAQGLIDESFNGGRPHVVDDAPIAWHGTAVQPDDGKVVVGGEEMIATGMAIHARFHGDGMLDQGYGQQALIREGRGYVYYVAIQPGAQRIILAGSYRVAGVDRPCLYGVSH